MGKKSRRNKNGRHWGMNKYKDREKLKQHARHQQIERKKQEFRGILIRIFQAEKDTKINRLEILGIVETGHGAGEVIYKVRRSSSEEICIAYIKNEQGKKMYKITHPAASYIEASTDCWIFIEDLED